MTTLSYILVILTLGISTQKHVEKQPFTIAVAPWKDTFAVGADVWIKVTLTNTSKEELDDSGNISGRTGLDPNFQYEVRDEKGGLVPKRRFDHPEIDTGSPTNRTLQPGETITQDQRVSALYDLSRPGKYTIHVSMPIPGTLGKSNVKSNIVTITLSK